MVVRFPEETRSEDNGQEEIIEIKMGGIRKYTPVQLYRFPLLMGGILGGIFTFFYTFSSANKDRIKIGSKKFTDAPKVTLQDDRK